MADDDPYEVVLASGVKRALSETLPASAAFAAFEFISGPLETNPRRVGGSLRALFEGYYRARRGEYPVRYRIDEENHRVYIFDVDHRRDACHS